ncbi:MAG: energy-coupling factor transporter transmembrane protein EcfT [Oscillospiraceae bacterium]|nr:energy-coupling factor transporter transmembrane protein EcfT [Oscillospiraceae bacterium]
MNEFKTYHPIVNFIYFVFVIGFSCVFMHPLCLVISLMCGFTYSVMLKGRGAIKRNLMYMLPMLTLMALINPAFNHEGITILAYLPGGNPLTLESVAYGFAAAAMIVSVILWFSCFNEIMTSDKFIYLFGRVFPAMSLIISMALRFVPRFAAQLKTVANAQKGIGRDASSGSVIKRAKCGLNILSIMTTWALENAVMTADSMKSRGYGSTGRTAFSIFIFDKRDKKALLCILLSGAYTFIGNMAGGMYFRYFPSLRGAKVSGFGISVFASYLLLCICPVIIELWEVRRWSALKSKI